MKKQYKKQPWYRLLPTGLTSFIPIPYYSSFLDYLKSKRDVDTRYISDFYLSKSSSLRNKRIGCTFKMPIDWDSISFPIIMTGFPEFIEADAGLPMLDEFPMISTKLAKKFIELGITNFTTYPIRIYEIQNYQHRHATEEELIEMNCPVHDDLYAIIQLTSEPLQTSYFPEYLNETPGITKNLYLPEDWSQETCPPLFTTRNDMRVLCCNEFIAKALLDFDLVSLEIIPDKKYKLVNQPFQVISPPHSGYSDNPARLDVIEKYYLDDDFDNCDLPGNQDFFYLETSYDKFDFWNKIHSTEFLENAPLICLAGFPPVIAQRPTVPYTESCENIFSTEFVQELRKLGFHDFYTYPIRLYEIPNSNYIHSSVEEVEDKLPFYDDLYVILQLKNSPIDVRLPFKFPDDTPYIASDPPNFPDFWLHEYPALFQIKNRFPNQEKPFFCNSFIAKALIDAGFRDIPFEEGYYASLENRYFKLPDFLQ
jgi:hypothetical protein